MEGLRREIVSALPAIDLKQKILFHRSFISSSGSPSPPRTNGLMLEE